MEEEEEEEERKWQRRVVAALAWLVKQTGVQSGKTRHAARPVQELSNSVRCSAPPATEVKPPLPNGPEEDVRPSSTLGDSGSGCCWGSPGVRTRGVAAIVATVASALVESEADLLA